jgi:histidine triad (HIT) family protein
MPATEPTVFELIVARELPATILFENERIIAISPLEKLAALHILVIPKTAAYRNVVELAEGDPYLMAEIVTTAGDLAAEHSNGEFRLVFNSGESAGQTVFHVHAHVLSGSLDESSLGD